VLDIMVTWLADPIPSLVSGLRIIGLYGAPWAILISGYVALRGIRNSSDVAGKRAALDFIEKSENTEGFREAVTAFRAYVREGRLAALHNPTSSDHFVDREKILRFLNHYELVSIAILQSFLDATIYREFMLTNFLVDWNEAADFIQRERWVFNSAENSWDYRYSLYENYEELVRQWANERGKVVKSIDEQSSEPPPTPAGVGGKVMLYNKRGNPFRKSA